MSILHIKQFLLSRQLVKRNTYLIKNAVSSSIVLEVKIYVIDCYGSHTVICASMCGSQDLAQHRRNFAGAALDQTQANVYTTSGSSKLLLSCCFFSIHHFILIRDAWELHIQIPSFLAIAPLLPPSSPREFSEVQLFRWSGLQWCPTNTFIDAYLWSG